MLFFFIPQIRTYYAIPRYDLSAEFIKENCERLLTHYNSSTWTKIVTFFLNKLFDEEIIIHCSSCGKKACYTKESVQDLITERKKLYLVRKIIE